MACQGVVMKKFKNSYAFWYEYFSSCHSNPSLGTNVTPGGLGISTEACLICKRRSVCNNRKLPVDRVVSGIDGSVGSLYIRDNASGLTFFDPGQ